ncbi:MAG TPA: hypothetical protein VME23_13765, partial [Terracidiphilus sp.]|nr:hypothetical protein [Terracidiphilus sp.]
MIDFPLNAPSRIGRMLLLAVAVLPFSYARAQSSPAFPHPSQQYQDDLRSAAGARVKSPAE